MLSQLDNIIFPDRCEVLEVAPQRFVYPIYKNGSSSLYMSGFRLLEHNELVDIPVIDVYVRNPYDRFITGVNTFLKHHKELDQATVLYFVKHYLFLNRHFCPQFYWLVNLQRFTNAKIRINHINSLSDITTLKDNSNEDPLLDEYLSYEKIHFYLSVDKVLTEDLLGQTVTFADIVKRIHTFYPEVYEEIIQRSINLGQIINV